MDRLNSYILIGGTGRCGTNILKDILTSSPQSASLPFEYRFTIDPDGLVDFFNSYSHSWSPFMADVKIKRLSEFLLKIAEKSDTKSNYKDWELNHWFPGYQVKVEELLEKIRKYTYQGNWPGAIRSGNEYNLDYGSPMNQKDLATIFSTFLQDVYDDFLNKKKASVFIEDNTWNILFARELAMFLPEYKLLHCIRDPRAVIASFLKQRWCPSDFKECVTFYNDIITKWFQIEKELPLNLFQYVKFENLILEPEKTIETISQFCELDFQPQFQSIELSKEPLIKWKSELSIEQINYINEECEFVLNAWNYNQ